ncbi:hypothetical protein DFH08DRAFT_1017063 [Mycena albidolilacea]|uniref:Uncharacterized protein n=1 Tax=Mycena albidolilacea TaxID=1033008 RepID=A0AAD7AQP9_9AGAR|nr:hypothetical protein DFH08DRAFT_1017063 [Mycena albidolilacea]
MSLHKILLAPAACLILSSIVPQTRKNVAAPKASGPRRFMQQQQGEVALDITSRIDVLRRWPSPSPHPHPPVPRYHPVLSTPVVPEPVVPPIRSAALLAAPARTFEDGVDSDSEHEHENGHDNDNGSESELSFEFDVVRGLSSVPGAKIPAHGPLVHSRLRNMRGAVQLQYPASSKRTSRAIAMGNKASSATYIPTHNSIRGLVNRYAPHTPHT